MRARDYATAMAAYNQWMNEKIYAAAAELSDAERKRDLGAFFRSIHGTLNHLLLGDLAWIERFEGRPVTMQSPDQELYADFAKLREAREAMDRRIADWAASLDESFADRPFAFGSVAYGRRRENRGQVTTLLKQLGKDPGVTDLPWLPWFD